MCVRVRVWLWIVLEACKEKKVQVHQSFLIGYIINNLISVAIIKELDKKVRLKILLSSLFPAPPPQNGVLLCLLRVIISLGLLWICPLFIQNQKIKYFLLSLLEKDKYMFFSGSFLHLVMHFSELSGTCRTPWYFSSSIVWLCRSY